jgi:hypothetical protein
LDDTPPSVSDFVLESLYEPNHMTFWSHIYKNVLLLKKNERKENAVQIPIVGKWTGIVWQTLSSFLKRRQTLKYSLYNINYQALFNNFSHFLSYIFLLLFILHRSLFYYYYKK